MEFIPLNTLQIDDLVPEVEGTDFQIIGSWLINENNEKYYVRREVVDLFNIYYGNRLNKGEAKSLLKLDSIMALRNLDFQVIPFVQHEQFEINVFTKTGESLSKEKVESLMKKYYSKFDREGYPIPKEGEIREEGTKYLVEESKKEKIETSDSLLKRLIIKFPFLSKLVFDKNILLDALKENKKSDLILYHIKDELLKDKEFMLNSIKINSNNYRMASKELIIAKDFALKCAEIDGTLLKHMSGTYTVDISYEPYYDRYGNKYTKTDGCFDFKDDCDVVLTAVKQNPLALQYADFQYPAFMSLECNDEKKRRIREIVLEALSKDIRMYRYVPEWMHHDSEILSYVQEEMLKEKEKTLIKK